jgi:hypothetical protein
MDAVKFVEERRRMFAVSAGTKYSLFDMNTSAEDVVKEVEEWSAAHPRKTRQSVFLKQFPNAKTVEGALAICPYNLGLVDKCKSELGRLCFDCRREFWMQEIE